MVSGSLALLPFIGLDLPLGNRAAVPNRGQSPVEWGDFPYLCPSVRPFPLVGYLARPEAQPAMPET